jgi:hypothetical protein
MKNLKVYIKNIGSALIIVMNVDGYRRTVMNDIKNKETDKVIQDIIRRSTELSNRLNDHIEQNVINNIEIENSLNKIKYELDTIQQKVNVLNKLLGEEYNKAISNIPFSSLEGGVNSINESLKKEAVKVNSVIDNILEFIDNTNGFACIQTFKDLLSNYYQIFDSLTIVQKSTLFQILFCISLLLCIYYILIAYYSDKLIIYFNLETKYPRLTIYIQLIRKFQHYNIKFNLILIIILTFLLLYINI